MEPGQVQSARIGTSGEYEVPSGWQKLLGLEIRADKTHVYVRVAKRLLWAGELRHLVAKLDKSERVSTAEVERLAGKNNFAVTHVLGRAARAINHAFYVYCNQYTSEALRRGKLAKRLAKCARWFIKAYENDDTVRQVPVKNVAADEVGIVYTDAEGTGDIGFVCGLHGSLQTEWGASTVPAEWRRFFRDRNVNVESWEMVAPLIVLHKYMMPGRRAPGWEKVKRVVFYIDNFPALCVLAKGRSTAHDHSEFACYFAHLCKLVGIDAVFEHVRSKLNPADPPSRLRVGAENNVEWCNAHLGQRVEAAWPAPPTFEQWLEAQAPTVTQLAQKEVRVRDP